MKFLVLALTLLSSFTFAQNSIQGKITDALDQAPLAGVIIHIPDLKSGTITTGDGSYLLENLPRGKFLIEFKFIGFSTVVKSVSIEGPTQLNISLSNAVTELNEIVITGVSHSTELKNNPIPITTLSNTLLTENTSTNLIDNITQKKGINQITTGPAISKPVIRGLGYNRIISLYDGIRQEGQQWGDEHGIEIDEYSVDRVEIIKGAGSLMYGSDGLGGVINFLTANPVDKGTISGRFTSNYQSNNGLIGNSFMNAGNNKGLYWQGRVSNKVAHAYQNAFDGKVFNSGFHENDFNGFLGINRAWGYSQVNLSSFHQDLGLTEGDRDANGTFTRLENVNGTPEEITVSDADLKSYSLFVPKQQIIHTRISNTSNIYMGGSHLQINVGYQRNQRKEFGDVTNENRKSLYFDLKSFNYNATYYLPELRAWQTSFGLSGMNQANENKGVEFLIPAYQSFDVGAFGFVKKQVGKLNLAGGIRFDERRISIHSLYLDENNSPTGDTNNYQKFKGANLTFHNYSSSAGLTYQVSKSISTKLNASRGYRAPSISELASNGRHEGALRYEYGNYNLKPETSFQLDVGAVLNSKHISAEVSVFQNTIHNYIYTEKLLSHTGSDSIPDPNEPVPAYQYVQGTAQLTGGEFSIDFHPHPLDWLHFENAFSFVNAINKTHSNDSSKYLPYIPAPRFQSELRANIKKTKTRFINLFIKIEYNHFGTQTHVLLENGTETPTNSYQLWNAGMGTDVTNSKGETLFSFYFTVTNLLDKAYQNNLSRLKYAAENVATGRMGVFNMGRNFSIKVVVPLTLKKS